MTFAEIDAIVPKEGSVELPYHYHPKIDAGRYRNHYARFDGRIYNLEVDLGVDRLGAEGLEGWSLYVLPGGDSEPELEVPRQARHDVEDLLPEVLGAAFPVQLMEVTL